jgi:UDP-galactopyranose mutase
MPTPEAKAPAERYRELAEQERMERGVVFAGRLAEYRYIDINHAFEGGLTAALCCVGLSWKWSRTACESSPCPAR